MNEMRTELIERIFIILDQDNDGVVDFKDLKAAYSAKRHPDVTQGRVSEEAALTEFYESFESNHVLFTGKTTARYPRVT